MRWKSQLKIENLTPCFCASFDHVLIFLWSCVKSANSKCCAQWPVRRWQTNFAAEEKSMKHGRKKSIKVEELGGFVKWWLTWRVPSLVKVKSVTRKPILPAVWPCGVSRVIQIQLYKQRGGGGWLNNSILVVCIVQHNNVSKSTKFSQVKNMEDNYMAESDRLGSKSCVGWREQIQELTGKIVGGWLGFLVWNQTIFLPI